jgi:TPR repeat protein
MESDDSPTHGTISTALMRHQAYRGSLTAMFGLYVVLKNGIGCKRNEVAARFWLRKAAFAGHTRSMWVLSWNYGSGRCGFSKNHEKERYWINQLVITWKANAAKGDPDAIAVLNRLSALRLARE